MAFPSQLKMACIEFNHFYGNGSTFLEPSTKLKDQKNSGPIIGEGIQSLHTKSLNKCMGQPVSTVFTMVW